jgi:hypothetical protein
MRGRSLLHEGRGSGRCTGSAPGIHDGCQGREHFGRHQNRRPGSFYPKGKGSAALDSLAQRARIVLGKACYSSFFFLPFIFSCTSFSSFPNSVWERRWAKLRFAAVSRSRETEFQKGGSQTGVWEPGLLQSRSDPFSGEALILPSFFCPSFSPAHLATTCAWR